MSLDIHLTEMREVSVFDANITHNLNRMAEAAGIYRHIWRPDELGITKASDLIDALESGLQSLLEKPDYYRQFNPENGWGDYDCLVELVREYLDACRESPNANIEVSR